MQLTLKNLIADILISSTAYDCMPINSAMCSIDKSVNLVTAINIFINEGVDELLVWDENESKWVWMMTLADIIRFISYGLKCVTKGQTISKSVLMQTLSVSKWGNPRRSPSQTSKPF